MFIKEHRDKFHEKSFAFVLVIIRLGNDRQNSPSFWFTDIESFCSYVGGMKETPSQLRIYSHTCRHVSYYYESASQQMQLQ